MHTLETELGYRFCVPTSALVHLAKKHNSHTQAADAVIRALAAQHIDAFSGQGGVQVDVSTNKMTVVTEVLKRLEVDPRTILDQSPSSKSVETLASSKLLDEGRVQVRSDMHHALTSDAR